MFTIAEKQALLSLKEDNLTFLKNENFIKEKVYEDRKSVVRERV